MSHPEPPERRDGDGGPDPEFTLAHSRALVPILVIAAITTIVMVVASLRGNTAVYHPGAPATRAFSPADFPMVFGTDQALAGLDGGHPGGGTPLYPVPAEPFSEGIFPCSNCHDKDSANPERRELEAMHTDIVLRHDEEHRWCLDCHDTNDRDHLRLASGTLVPFSESYRLCGQCHGTQFRDWRSGIHGKRTGYWNGSKRYLLCVHCHNPHNPRFAALAPLPPPVRPEFLQHPE